MLKTIKTNIVHKLHLEAGGNAIRSGGAGGVGAACIDIAEIAGAAVSGRTLPPNGNSTRGIMLIHDFAVAGRVIGVLFKIVRLLGCGILYCAKYLIFR